VPGSLDKKGGRKIPSMFHLCLIKDGTGFPSPFLSNEPGTGVEFVHTTPACLISNKKSIKLNLI
jgi:hypothetical protein